MSERRHLVRLTVAALFLAAWPLLEWSTTYVVDWRAVRGWLIIARFPAMFILCRELGHLWAELVDRPPNRAN